MVFTSDGELLRCCHHDGCGHFDWFLKRVRNEAAAIETAWVFGATLPRPQPFWELLVDDDGNEIDEILRPPSSSRWTATWYAEARGGWRRRHPLRRSTAARDVAGRRIR